ncbi:unnamed protein product [Allacma fusca]|uniref:SAM domain-containing protein n=1 Tax=Allacma fusca TaxID=39272 RepID=A0A8J2M632_9HEXA|nr:unnamed protein product [Allacma fusca]
MVQLSNDVLRMFLRNKRLSSLPIYEQYRIKNMIEYWTPKDRAEWNAFMLKLVKKKTCVTYLSDQALLNVIQAARHTIWKQFSKQPETLDPDLPACYYWTEKECAEWIAASGFPEMKEAFLINHITGNKLIALDACAISKMGVRYFDTIKGITAKIREVLNIPKPNMMRALMRISPMEEYLRKRLYKGRTYNLLKFEKFCEDEGFPYHFLTKTDTNARIPSTCRLMLHLFPELTPSDSESSSDTNSLDEVPTVELITRHALMRNRIIQSIIDSLVDLVFSPDHRDQCDGLAMDTMRNFLELGWRELGYDERIHGKERIQFAVDVSKGLITEMMRTAQVLQDIQTTRKHIQAEISPETYNDMKEASEILLEAVLPIAALLASGELELESIFQQEPQFQYYVDSIVKEAEEFTNTVIPKTENLIDEILKEAKLKIVSTLFPEIPISTIRSATKLMDNLLDDLIQEGIADYDEAELDIGFENIEMDIDDDIQSMLGSLTALPVRSQSSKLKPKPKSPVYTQEEKFDPESGMPILNRLTEDEIDNILQSGKIETKDGRKVSNNELLNRAMSEKKRRKSLSRQPSKTKKKKFSPREKLDHDGAPIVRRLSDKELEDIVNTGKLETTDGGKVSINEEVANDARAEMERRQKGLVTTSRNGLQQVHAVKYPGKYTNDGAFEQFTRQDKFDDYGKPILNRFTVDELDHILTAGSIETKDGKRISVDTAMLKEAREESQRRINIVQEALQQTNPGKYIPDVGFQEFTRDEKFDEVGMPIFERLTGDELNTILETEKIEAKDGTQVSLNPELLELAKKESKRRNSLAKPAQNPGKYTKDGVFEEYSQEEKMDGKGNPIVERLTFDELEEILATGQIEGDEGKRRSVSVEILNQARAERKQRRKSLKHPTKSDNILQQAHILKNPGRITSEGTFEPFKEEEKFDEAGSPILDRLTDDQLENIIFTGNIPTVDGEEEPANDDIVQKARAVQQKRRDTINLTQKEMQEESFQRKYPGEYDSHGVYREFNQKEKFDPTTNQPILERLNHKELEQVINTGLINNKNGPTTIPEEIRELAKLERRKRDRQEGFAQIQKENYMRKYPGKTDADGRFQEYSTHEKVDSNGKPIIERLNLRELQKLIDFKMFYGTPINVDEILDRARSELDKRKAEEAQDKMRLQVNRKNYPGKIVDGEFQEYTYEEKFDTSGFPIFSHLNSDELDEIIKSGEVPTIDGILITDEKLLQAARSEKQKRVSLEKHLKAEEKIFRRTYLTDPPNFSTDEKYDSTGQPIFERFTDTDLEEVTSGQRRTSQPDEVVRAIQEIERRRESRKVAVRNQESAAIQEYRKKFPRQGPLSKSVGSVPSKLKLQDILSKEKLTPEQRRLETLEAIKDLVSKNQEQKLNEVKAMPKTVTSNANLALFNGFIIDDFANVVGTADPFDGKIKDKTGNVLGIITSQGMVFTPDGVALGRLGADVEQIGVGKFRALPKDVETPEESSTSISVKDDVTKSLPQWNSAQAEVKGGLLLKKGEEWVREMEPTSEDLARKTEIALQIQQVEGYSPEQIILLEDEPTKVEKPLKDQGTTKIPSKGKKPTKEPSKSLDETPQVSDEVNKLIAKEHEKSKERQKAVRAKTLGAAQREVGGLKGIGGSTRGEETFLNIVDKKDLIAVPVPVSGKWGVQTPPYNEDEPHFFKPPRMTSPPRRPTHPQQPSVVPASQEKTNSQDMMLKVKTGEAKKLVAADGSVVGEIRKDGNIVNAEGQSVGRVEEDGSIVKEDGTAMPDTGLKVIRPNGVVVGHVSEKGKLSPDREKERLLIGRIWGDGRIVTMENALVGVVTKDGRIVGPEGKAIGLFTPGWELLGTDGVPFAYVTSNGKVYRYEVIAQKRFDPIKTTKKDSLKLIDPDKSEAVIIFHKKRSLDFAFELPRIKDTPQDFTLEDKKYSFEEFPPDSRLSDDIDVIARKRAEKERIKQDEEMRKQYDLDESHKRAIVKPSSGGSRDLEVGVGTQTSTIDTTIKDSYEVLRPGTSGTDHRVAKTSQEYLKQKQLHRKQLIENWANEVSDLMETKPDYFTIDPKLSSEERSRIARMAADNILDDIFKLALTHLLLQAEAGENTQKILAALASIQTTGEGQALWQTHTQEDKRKSKMILKNMISFLPKPGDERKVPTSEDNLRETKSQEPETAEAGVNTDADQGKERRRRHHHRRRRKNSNVMDISVGKDDDDAVVDKKRVRTRDAKTDSKPVLQIKGQFSRIINPDEIEQFNQVFDNTGGRFAPNMVEPTTGQHRKGQRGKGGQLQHIPHPGVVDKGGKTVSAREDVAEQIHHGKKILADKELPIQPQNQPLKRRSMK